MKIYYDTEFLEDGKTIELISIGLVAEDGEELYCISGEAPVDAIYRHDWLRLNVFPHLPLKYNARIGHVEWDDEHPDFAKNVWSRKIIATATKSFILSKSDPELWAWYGAYDHVALCQLWGPMSNLPDGIPMWTNDLRQEVHRLEKLLNKPIRLPVLNSELHHAMADARELKARADWLEEQVG